VSIPCRSHKQRAGTCPLTLVLTAVLCVAPALAGCAALVEPLEVPSAPEVVVSEELPIFLQVAACSATEDYARALAEAFRGPRSSVVIDVRVASPQVAVDMVAGGEAQLAVVTAAPGEKVQSSPLDSSLPVEAQAVATTGVSLIVHASREVPSLTQTDVVALYSGYVLDWADLGVGIGAPYVVAQDASSPSRGVFDERLMEGRPIGSATVLVPDDRSVVRYVAEHPTAVGYAAASVLDNRVRTVPVETGLSSRSGAGRMTALASLDVVMVTPVTSTVTAAELGAYARGALGRQLLAKHFP